MSKYVTSQECSFVSKAHRQLDVKLGPAQCALNAAKVEQRSTNALGSVLGNYSHHPQGWVILWGGVWIKL
jgi:hypothetical protein